MIWFGLITIVGILPTAAGEFESSFGHIVCIPEHVYKTAIFKNIFGPTTSEMLSHTTNNQYEHLVIILL